MQKINSYIPEESIGLTFGILWPFSISWLLLLSGSKSFISLLFLSASFIVPGENPIWTKSNTNEFLFPCSIRPKITLENECLNLYKSKLKSKRGFF